MGFGRARRHMVGIRRVVGAGLGREALPGPRRHIPRGGGGLPASVIGKRGEEGGKIPPKLSIAALEILLS